VFVPVASETGGGTGTGDSNDHIHRRQVPTNSFSQTQRLTFGLEIM